MSNKNDLRRLVSDFLSTVRVRKPEFVPFPPMPYYESLLGAEGEELAMRVERNEERARVWQIRMEEWRKRCDAVKTETDGFAGWA